MQMRISFGAYAFYLLHFDMYSARTPRTTATLKVRLELSFSFTRYPNEYKKNFFYTENRMHTQKLFEQRLFSSLHNCKCFIHSFSVLFFPFALYLKLTRLFFSVYCIFSIWIKLLPFHCLYLFIFSNKIFLLHLYKWRLFTSNKIFLLRLWIR